MSGVAPATSSERGLSHTLDRPSPPRRFRWPLYRQPPAYSPLPVAAIVRAAALGLSDDPRPRVADLLRREYGADAVVLCGSGTEALQLAIVTAARILGEPPRVALPAFTCYEVAAAAVRTSDRIALYDLNPDTLAPDLDSLDRAVAEGVRIVVVSPLYGIPIDWEELEGRLAPHGALAIEDAAQGHGASWRGRRLGSWGRLSVLSFGRGKGWTAGRGGALLVRCTTGVDLSLGRESEADLLPSAASQSDLVREEVGLVEEVQTVLRAAAQSVFARPSSYAVPSSLPWLALGQTRYRDARSPRAITRTAAAILEATRETAEKESRRRRESAGAMLDAIASEPGCRPARVPPEGVAGYLRLPVRLSRGWTGLADVERAARLGIAPTYPSTLAAIPAVRARLSSAVPDHWPGAERLVRELVTLPCHSLITPREREEIPGVLREHVAQPSATVTVDDPRILL